MRCLNIHAISAMALTTVVTTACGLPTEAITATGEVVVRVEDASAGPIPEAIPIGGVTVSIVNARLPSSQARLETRVATTDAEGSVEFTDLRASDYRITISDLPDFPEFAETERVVFVGAPSKTTHSFRSMREGVVQATVTADDAGLDDVLVELLDSDGEVIATARTETNAFYAVRFVRFGGLRRRAYEVRVSGPPDWVSFDALSQPVVLGTSLEDATASVAFDGTVIGEREVEVLVTADGDGLDGVLVEAVTYVVDDRRVHETEVTDSDGRARFRNFPVADRTFEISGFDEAEYEFVSARFLLAFLEPGVRTIRFEATAADEDRPAVVIEVPGEGARFVEGDSIWVYGSAVDPQSGELTGEALAWSSDRDGALGTGQGLWLDDLTVGDHVLTLTATDPDGNSGSASIGITIAPNGPPTASVTSPASGSRFVEGDAVTFRGSATDAEEGFLSGSSLTWASDLDGDIGTGELFLVDDLSLGTHVVTLTATDDGGLTATATVTVEIAPNSPPTASIGAPAAGARFNLGASVAFEGSAADAEDGALGGSALEWSSDLNGVLGTGTSLSRDDLSPGTHLVTLRATDSHGGSGDASITIIINAPPVVSITEPAITLYDEDSDVPFEGSALDPEDGPLTGAALVWTSSWEGMIGTGTSFSSSDLRVGSHLITLTATDSEGLSATATKAITILGSGVATIQGRVQVPGFGIAGVTVTATNYDSGVLVATAITDANGDYTMAGLAPATYEIEISGTPPWFVFDTTSRVVTIAAGQTLNIDFHGTGG